MADRTLRNGVSQMPLYSHQDIDGPTELNLHTRFVQLQPSLSANGCIQCTVVHGKISRKGSDQSSHQSYYALSYEWGTKQNSREIEVNGCRFSIRQNLWQYLDVARRTLELHATALWVDSICINQDNTQERNEQVSYMGDIYANADRVVVWLGFRDATVEKTLAFLDHCHKAPADQNLAWALEEMNEAYSPAKVKAHKAFLENLARNRFGLSGSISDLFGRVVDLTYWTRAWMAQELFHARCIWSGLTADSDIKKYVTFHYGEQWTNFECLHTSATAIKCLLRPTDPRFWRFKSFTHYMSLLSRRNARLDLHRSLPLFNDWPASSTEPRDLIYALRSMFFGGEHLEIEYGESLDLLMLRMLVQLKYRQFQQSDRNWLDYDEVRSLVYIASRFGVSMTKFHMLILKAAEKLRLADPCAVSPGLKRQYEEALVLLDDGFVQCNRPVVGLPWDIRFSSPKPCPMCAGFAWNTDPPSSPEHIRRCSHCNAKELPWDMVLSRTMKDRACSESLLIPPAFPSSARYACGPATGVGTHFWLAPGPPSHEDAQSLHVLDLHLAVGGPWRIQFYLPNVRSVKRKGTDHLTVDLKTWLLICVLEEIQKQYLLGAFHDQNPPKRIQDYLREVEKIAKPRLEDEAMPLPTLSFWFVTMAEPGQLVTADEFKAQLNQNGADDKSMLVRDSTDRPENAEVTSKYASDSIDGRDCWAADLTARLLSAAPYTD